MRNQDIEIFFKEWELEDRVEHQSFPPTDMWVLEISGFPVFIQTQESANRMRIVALITDAAGLDDTELRRLLDANYASALDARYALTDGHLVAAFLHPLDELDFEQFILGFYQVLTCAETWGTDYTGGTLLFGPIEEQEAGEAVEDEVVDIREELVLKIRGEPEPAPYEIN